MSKSKITTGCVEWAEKDLTAKLDWLKKLSGSRKDGYAHEVEKIKRVTLRILADYHRLLSIVEKTQESVAEHYQYSQQIYGPAYKRKISSIQIYKMHAEEKKSYNDIAKALGCSKGTVIRRIKEYETLQNRYYEEVCSLEEEKELLRQEKELLRQERKLFEHEKNGIHWEEDMY